MATLLVYENYTVKHKKQGDGTRSNSNLFARAVNLSSFNLSDNYSFNLPDVKET